MSPAKIFTSALDLLIRFTVSNICIYLILVLSLLGLLVYETICVVKRSMGISSGPQIIRALPNPFCTNTSPSNFRNLPLTLKGVKLIYHRIIGNKMENVVGKKIIVSLRSEVF